MTYVVIAKSKSCKKKKGKMCFGLPLIAPYTISKVMDRVQMVMIAPISTSAKI